MPQLITIGKFAAMVSSLALLVGSICYEAGVLKLPFVKAPATPDSNLPSFVEPLTPGPQGASDPKTFDLLTNVDKFWRITPDYGSGGDHPSAWSMPGPAWEPGEKSDRRSDLTLTKAPHVVRPGSLASSHEDVPPELLPKLTLSADGTWYIQPPPTTRPAPSELKIDR